MSSIYEDALQGMKDAIKKREEDYLKSLKEEEAKNVSKKKKGI